MYRIARWDPMRDMLGITERMTRLFDEYARRGGVEDEAGLGAMWAPAVDVRESATQLVLGFELAGVDPNEVEISVENNRLTVRGERKFEKAEEGETYHRVERAYGSFERTFQIPVAFAAEMIEAKAKNGVLTLTIPKREEAKPRSIRIAVEES
jgi:HSP20 family protein